MTSVRLRLKRGENNNNFPVALLATNSLCLDNFTLVKGSQMTEASVAVVGAGVIGLTTALELARSGLKVTIMYAFLNRHFGAYLP